MNRLPLLLDPPNCFFTVLRTADRTACFGVFFFDATSSNSGMLCDKNFLPIAGSKNFLANGKATRPTPAANDPKPLPRCLAGREMGWLCLLGVVLFHLLKFSKFECESN